MKKVVSILSLIILLALPVFLVQAQQATVAPTLTVCCGPNSVLVRIVNWAFTILLVVAAIWLIIAAYNFVTAGGDTEKIKTARNFVLYAVVGVLIAFLAKGLIEMVRTITGA